MGDNMIDFYWKDYPGGSLDICFCKSDCTNGTCRRCKHSETYKRLMKFADGNPYYGYAVSDFHEKCSKYKGESK